MLNISKYSWQLSAANYHFETKKNFLSLSFFVILAAERELMWSNVASAAETGWDFSTRWFAQSGPSMHHMKSIRTISIVPVDLNAFMCINARILAALFEITG